MRKLLYLIPLVLLLVGCIQKTSQVDTQVDIINKEWQEIETLAKAKEVKIFMWGGDENVNRYMDQWVAPKLQEQYGIKFVRVPMDAPEFMQKLMTEKKAEVKEGTIDIIWINGENFANAKKQDLISPAFVDKLPNYTTYVDVNSPNVQYDFGTPVDGREAPWGKVQFVTLYDSDKVTNPPKNFAELLEWTKANPGKFTYPDAAEFTGNAFLRLLMYNFLGVENLMKENAESMVGKAEPVWNYLTELKPYLWREGQTYPQSLAQLDQMYGKGEVLFTMGYNEARAESLIKQGVFPKGTKSLILEPGSIGNTHFLAIPYNSPNTAGALVAINFLLSPEAQLAKMDPAGWGDSTVLDTSKLPENFKEQLSQMNRGESVLTPEELAKALLPEVKPEYVDLIKEKWLSEVAKTTN